MTFRLAVLGGSAVSTVQLVDALADWPGGRSRRPAGLTIALHGRSAERLAAVSSACRKRADSLGVPAQILAEPDLAAALDGADAVLNQVRVGGLEARSSDESFPRPFGVPGEETMGPGGLACAVRTVSALRPVWSQIARSASDALVVNLTNPAGIVQQAARADGLRQPVLTVCDSPLSLLEQVTARLGIGSDDARRRYVGMNHVGWYVPAEPAELSGLAGLPGGLDEIAAVHEALPAPYMRYYALADVILATQQGQPTRAQELLALQQQTLRLYREGAVPDRWQRQAPWYRLAVLPVLDAWLNGSQDTLIIGTPNAGRIPWLPGDVIIEAPSRISEPHRIEHLPVPALPDLPRGLLARHASYELLAVQALAGEPTAEGLTRALLANPMVSTLRQARALAQAILRQLADDPEAVSA